MLKLFSTQLLVNSEIFKLSLNLSLKLLRVQSGCYELKGDLSPIILKEIFHNSLKISKFTRICMENLSNMTRWQKLFLVQILLNLTAIVIATFERYGWKVTVYLILICYFRKPCWYDRPSCYYDYHLEFPVLLVCAVVPSLTWPANFLLRQSYWKMRQTLTNNWQIFVKYTCTWK